MLVFVSLLYPLCGLAENLKVAKNCVLEGARRKNSLGAMRGVLVYSPNALKDMFDVCSLGFHNGIDSRSTASRISGLSERRITT